MFKVGLIGYGYWGSNLLRNLINSERVSDIIVCDLLQERLDIVQKKYPTIKVSTNFEETISQKKLDIILIATPTSTHYKLAKMALLSGKHTLVEKPLCSSSVEAEKLYKIAQEKKLILYTDLTFLFNGAVKYIEDYIRRDHLGRINYIDSTRINLGIYHSDTNVVWDLATHDVSIIQKLINKSPTHIRAVSSHTQKNHTDLAYIFLYYPNNLLVHINCSWASPTKIRQMIIGGEKKMIIYDEVEPTHKIKIYEYAQSDQINNRNKTLVDYRLGDVSIPKFSTTEPLRKMLDTFFDCVSNGQYKVISPNENIEIIRILECIEESLAHDGKLIVF